MGKIQSSQAKLKEKKTASQDENVASGFSCCGKCKKIGTSENCGTNKKKDFSLTGIDCIGIL